MLSFLFKDRTRKGTETSLATDADAEAEAKQRKMDAEMDDQHRRRAADVYRFLEAYEETKLMDKQSKATPSFIKEYEAGGNDNDWKMNHYFFKDKPDGKQDQNCGIVLTSYQLEELKSSCEKTSYRTSLPFSLCQGGGNEKSALYYVKLEKLTSAAPVQNISGDPDVKAFLENLKQNNPDLFSSKSLHEILVSLTLEELERLKPLKEVACFAQAFWKALVDEELKQASKTLHSWYRGSIDTGLYDLVMGIGHVRQVFTSNKKKQNEPEEKRIINSPLIEVLVRVEVCRDSGSIMIAPEENARLKWNGEAKSVLLTTGGGKEMVAKLHRLVSTGSVEEIIPSKPETFQKYLQAACDLYYNGIVKESEDSSLHVPPDDPDTLVLSGGWCLFVRPKRSTTISRDASAIAKAIENKMIELSSPVCSLVQDSETTPLNSTKDEAVAFDDANFHIPLPASKSQLHIMEKIYAKESSVSVIQGGPGTGKTQTGVNFSTLELQRGSTVLVSSPNSRALEAFVEKLPPELRMFCVDMASLEEGGIASVAGALECMQIDYTNLMGQADEYEKKITANECQILKKKTDRTKCKDKLSSFSSFKRGLMKRGGFNKIIRHALGQNSETSAVVLWALQDEHFDVTLEKLLELVKAQRLEKTESLQLESGSVGKVTPALLKLVQQKGAGEHTSPTTEVVSGRRLVFAFDAGSTNSFQEELNKIKVGAGNGVFKTPTNSEEWDRVFRGLRLKKDMCEFYQSHVMPLLLRGFPKSQVFASEGGSIRQEFVDMLTTLKDDLAAVSSDDRSRLSQLLADISMNRKMQAQITQLSKDIQALEAKLLFAKVARSQSQSITAADLGKLNQLAQLAGKMKSKDAQSDKTFTGKAMRRNQNFEKAFQDALPIMRLVVASPEQVSRFVPVGHRFGQCIVDEASQADCSALTLMIRADQMVVIGDDKQVCPVDHKWTDEGLNALDANLPDIPSTRADNLKPRHSFFNLCQVTFTLSSAFLQDHFRCPPDGIAWSSEALYHNRINTYKPSTNEPTLLHFHVNGKMDTNKKTNEVEARKIVHFVKESIEKAAADDGYPVLTFGIISMAGDKQCKLIEELIREALEDLCNQHGSKIIDRHQIKYGVPHQFQGSERDVILISCVYDKPSAEIDQESQKIWNVATTRHKCQSVLFHSYDPMDKHKVKLPIKDHKREIFAQYKRAEYASKNPWKKVPNDVRGMAERKLRAELLSHGFLVARNEGNVWDNALTVGVKGGAISKNCVLLILENHGESDDDWMKTVDQQWDLEQAGTACLRVDTLALSLSFGLILDDILKFLKEAGLSPIPVAKAPVASTKENMILKVSESSSDAESTLTSPPSTVEPQRKRRGNQKKGPAAKKRVRTKK